MESFVYCFLCIDHEKQRLLWMCEGTTINRENTNDFFCILFVMINKKEKTLKVEHANIFLVFCY